MQATTDEHPALWSLVSSWWLASLRDGKTPAVSLHATDTARRLMSTPPSATTTSSVRPPRLPTRPPARVRRPCR